MLTNEIICKQMYSLFADSVKIVKLYAPSR
nr:MAG TPA: hypothetical protein [Caudoviricetes sp.]